jgi:hypothetical protein
MMGGPPPNYYRDPWNMNHPPASTSSSASIPITAGPYHLPSLQQQPPPQPTPAVLGKKAPKKRKSASAANGGESGDVSGTGGADENDVDEEGKKKRPKTIRACDQCR